MSNTTDDNLFGSEASEYSECLFAYLRGLKYLSFNK